MKKTYVLDGNLLELTQEQAKLFDWLWTEDYFNEYEVTEVPNEAVSLD